jgi:hypothetical protein
VTGAKLDNGAVTASKVREHSLQAEDFKPGQLPRGLQGVSITSAAVPAASSRCPYGGSSFTAVNATTYACNGAPGTAGRGFQFTNTSGDPGPTLSRAATYFVNVEADITGPVTGDCFVAYTATVGEGIVGGPTGLGGAVAAGSSAPPFSFAGMVTGVPAGGQLSLVCKDSSGNAVTPSKVQWWVSEISS